jgi:hypothetical protein
VFAGKRLESSLKVTDSAVVRNHVPCHLNVPAALFFVPRNPDCVDFIHGTRGKFQGPITGRKYVLEIDVSGLRKIVSIALHATKYVTILVVRKCNDADQSDS